MNTHNINGICYARMLRGAASVLSEHVQELNALNVFPVADGDTGTNMLSTLEGGLARIGAVQEESIGAASELFSEGLMLSARGNSGVILSQFFAGMNEVLRECTEADTETFSSAFECGVRRSYRAVQTPVEGTILTVLRESTEHARKSMKSDGTAADFLQLHSEQARRSVENTKQLLACLSEADVVDSGGAGYMYIAEGMYRALTGKELSYTPSRTHNGSELDIDSFTRDSILEYGYCTEVLLRLTTAKTDPAALSVDTVTEALTSLGGESIVAYKQGDIVKVHVHTYTPEAVLGELHRYGEFLSVKVENMSLSHTDSAPAPKKSKKKFSVAAVSSGDGISALFSELGADVIIGGGQGHNPSVREFTDAFDKCGTDDIIVLPNNKNILLAALSAKELYSRARIHVINTKSITQGYAALSVITPGLTDITAVIESAQRAADNVIDGEVSRAVRSATISGTEVTEGGYIAISSGEVLCCEPTAEDAVIQLLSRICTEDCELITLFVSRDTDECKRAALTEKLKALYSGCEITVYTGGQDVYDYLVSVE